ncbi:hypothetical protein BH10CYA1_BH10CYA1_49310 [soil metagenome]
MVRKIMFGDLFFYSGFTQKFIESDGNTMCSKKNVQPELNAAAHRTADLQQRCSLNETCQEARFNANWKWNAEESPLDMRRA